MLVKYNINQSVERDKSGMNNERYMELSRELESIMIVLESSNGNPYLLVNQKKIVTLGSGLLLYWVFPGKLSYNREQRRTSV